ncbi:putative secreted protein [Fasciola hepatica]|uniref:Secreted protein n=1 Tax=Fasciola hepatica TaxID=6192 RepID=A0A4E0RXG3_FASHE|nr:putative secreted protein [Fasciola hepatica]
MFGAIVAGKPVSAAYARYDDIQVQTDFSPVDTNKFLLRLAPLNDVNHVVVFLTGTVPLPDQLGAGVYLGIQRQEALIWYFLGVLTNERPSAIYKVGNLRKSAQLGNGANPFGMHFDRAPYGEVGVEAQLGISVEPLTNLPQRNEGFESESTGVDTMTRFTRFAAESLFNYVSSFAHDSLSSSDPLVPISSIKRWFDTILRKLSVDPTFWKN